MATETEMPASADPGEGETPVEDAPADQAAATAENADAGAETPAEPAEGEAKPEGEPKEAKPAEIPEAELKAAAEKYAKGLVTAANRTMAAARRAEQAAERGKAEVADLTGKLKLHTDFVAELQTNPFAAIRKIGFKSLREFVERGKDAGGEPVQPTADDRVTQLEKMLKERDDKEAAREAERITEESKGRVFAAIDKLTDRYDFATTDIGHDQLWEGIMTYHKDHGSVPDEVVFIIADGVEKELEKKLSNVRKIRQGQGAKTGQPAGTKAATPARTAGKTIANASASGAPSRKEYSMDPDERDRQINEELRAEGLL
jgi:hypothetical protein